MLYTLHNAMSLNRCAMSITHNIDDSTKIIYYLEAFYASNTTIFTFVVNNNYKGQSALSSQCSKTGTTGMQGTIFHNLA